MAVMRDDCQRDAILADIARLPGGSSPCEKFRSGKSPWKQIEDAAVSCTRFPTQEFHQAQQNGEMEMRWPLTFPAWFRGACGMSVDSQCADFILEAATLDEVREQFRQFTWQGEWLDDWRRRFEKVLDGRR